MVGSLNSSSTIPDSDTCHGTPPDDVSSVLDLSRISIKDGRDGNEHEQEEIFDGMSLSDHIDQQETFESYVENEGIEKRDTRTPTNFAIT